MKEKALLLSILPHICITKMTWQHKDRKQW